MNIIGTSKALNANKEKKIYFEKLVFYVFLSPFFNITYLLYINKMRKFYK